MRVSHLIPIIKDLRYLRVFHYLLWGLLGTSMLPKGFELNLTNIFFVILAVVFGIIFSIVTNNIYDSEIDRISNPTRPLIKGEIPQKDYLRWGYLFLFLSLLCSLQVSFEIFILNGIFILAYFFYSAPPIRFKRVPILSKWIIGINSLVLLDMGRVLFSPGDYLAFLPSIFIILGVGTLANFIDLKDIEGDRALNIKTLPVLLGEENAKRLIGRFFLILYPTSIILLMPFFSQLFLWSFIFPITVVVGIFQYFLIRRKNYNEVPVFLINNLNILILSFFLFNDSI